jgi:hypothetical protein
MKSDFQQGRLDLNFPVRPFDAPMPVLGDTFSVFFANLPFLATVTLGVFIPGKLAIQFLAYLLNVPTDGLTSYIMLSAGDLLLEPLVVPAIIFGLVQRFHGATPNVAESLRWGRRQWLRTLGNDVRVEITVGLGLLLLVIPGIIAALRLTYVEVVVAVEGDTQTAVMPRSEELAKGRLWRILWVMLPLGLLNGAASYLLVDRMPAVANSRPLFAIVESLLAAIMQLSTVAALLMYLGSLPVSGPGSGPQNRVTKL